MPTLDKETIEQTLLIIGLSSTIYPIVTSILYYWRTKSRDKRTNIPAYKVRSAILAHKASFAGYILAIILSNIILLAFYSKHVGLGTLILSGFFRKPMPPHFRSRHKRDPTTVLQQQKMARCT